MKNNNFAKEPKAWFTFGKVRSRYSLYLYSPHTCAVKDATTIGAIPIQVPLFLTTLLLFLIPTIALSQYTDEINSNRPGKSMSSFAVGKRVFQIETGFTGYHDFHDTYRTETKALQSELTLRYGLFLENLEAIAEIQHQKDTYEHFRDNIGIENRSFIKSFTFGLKYLIYDPALAPPKKTNYYSWKANQPNFFDKLVPAVAFYAGVNVKTNDYLTFENEPSITPKFILTTQNQFDKNWIFVTNLIADKLSTDYPTYGGIATLTHGFSLKWYAFGEFQYFINDLGEDKTFRAGVAHLINSNVQIDASFSKNTGHYPNIKYGSIGLSWRFDNAYQEVLISRKVNFKKQKNKGKSKK